MFYIPKEKKEDKPYDAIKVKPSNLKNSEFKWECVESLSAEDLVTIFAKGSMNGQTQITFTKSELSNVRAKAIRQGVWFRVLSRAERVYMELVLKVVDMVRSHFVAKLLLSIVEKLLNATRSKVVRLMEEIGQTSAHKLCLIAQKWGNVCAYRWVKNRGFIQYLAVTYMNRVGSFGPW